MVCVTGTSSCHIRDKSYVLPAILYPFGSRTFLFLGGVGVPAHIFRVLSAFFFFTGRLSAFCDTVLLRRRSVVLSRRSSVVGWWPVLDYVICQSALCSTAAVPLGVASFELPRFSFDSSLPSRLYLYLYHYPLIVQKGGWANVWFLSPSVVFAQLAMEHPHILLLG